MTITAHAGPLISFGNTPYAPSANDNPEAGPSLFFAGAALLDPRPFYGYEPGQNFGNVVAGFSTLNVNTLNVAPAAPAVGAVAAAQFTVAGTPMVLASASANGVVAPVSVVNAATGLTVAGAVAIQNVAARVSYGSAATVQLWDPATLLSRTLAITSAAAATGGAITIRGLDVYGFPITDTIIAVAASQVVGLKAFKYITSVTPSFTDAAHTYSVDTLSVFGFPLASSVFNSDILIMWGGVDVTSATGYLPAVNTLATALTGDVRGTYAVQTAANGVTVLYVTQIPTVQNLALTNGVAGASTGLFGVVQF